MKIRELYISRFKDSLFYNEETDKFIFGKANKDNKQWFKEHEMGVQQEVFFLKYMYNTKLGKLVLG